MVILNGNQTCMMFCWYIIANKKKLGQLKGNEFLVKTIVTTEVIAKIAEKNGVELRDCYTGFKWSANEIRISESKQKYIGGGEESFGFLPSTRSGTRIHPPQSASSAKLPPGLRTTARRSMTC